MGENASLPACRHRTHRCGYGKAATRLRTDERHRWQRPFHAQRWQTGSRGEAVYHEVRADTRRIRPERYRLPERPVPRSLYLHILLRSAPDAALALRPRQEGRLQEIFDGTDMPFRFNKRRNCGRAAINGLMAARPQFLPLLVISHAPPVPTIPH